MMLWISAMVYVKSSQVNRMLWVTVLLLYYGCLHQKMSVRRNVLMDKQKTSFLECRMTKVPP